MKFLNYILNSSSEINKIRKKGPTSSLGGDWCKDPAGASPLWCCSPCRGWRSLLWWRSCRRCQPGSPSAHLPETLLQPSSPSPPSSSGLSLCLAASLWTPVLHRNNNENRLSNPAVKLLHRKTDRQVGEGTFALQQLGAGRFLLVVFSARRLWTVQVVVHGSNQAVVLCVVRAEAPLRRRRGRNTLARKVQQWLGASCFPIGQLTRRRGAGVLARRSTRSFARLTRGSLHGRAAEADPGLLVLDVRVGHRAATALPAGASPSCTVSWGVTPSGILWRVTEVIESGWEERGVGSATCYVSANLTNLPDATEGVVSSFLLNILRGLTSGPTGYTKRPSVKCFKRMTWNN